MRSSGQELVILLVEDNPGDVCLMREALGEVGFPHVLHVAARGDDALRFLREQASGGRHRPGLVILDLNLPGKNGRQVMAEMQAEPDLKALPVAILSTSHGESRIGRDFPHLRSTFATKTSDLRQLVEIVHRFRAFAAQPS